MKFKLINLAISLLLLSILFVEIDIDAISLIIIKSDIGYIFAALSILLLQVLFSAKKWQYILSLQVHHIEYKELICNLWCSLFVNQVLPSGAAGEINRVFFLKKRIGNYKSALLNIFWDKLIGLYGLVTMVFFSLPLMFFKKYLNFFHLGVAVFGFFSLFFLILLNLGKIRKISFFRSLNFIEQLESDVMLFLKKRTNLIKLISFSFLIQFMSFIAFIFLTKAFNIYIDYSIIFFIVPVALIIMIIPISYGGWGIREVFIVYSFSLLGFSADIGLTLSVSFGLLLVFASLPGIIMCSKLHSSN